MTYPIAADLDAPPQSLPRVSVIATWTADLALLKQWFAALDGGGSAVPMEVIVVAPVAGLSSVEQDCGVAGRFRIRMLEVSPERSVGEMRRAGMAAATGDVVVLTDDRDAGFERRLASIIRGIEQRSGRTA
jgi:hypothetical protein